MPISRTTKLAPLAAAAVLGPAGLTLLGGWLDGAHGLGILRLLLFVLCPVWYSLVLFKVRGGQHTFLSADYLAPFIPAVACLLLLSSTSSWAFRDAELQSHGVVAACVVAGWDGSAGVNLLRCPDGTVTLIEGLGERHRGGVRSRPIGSSLSVRYVPRHFQPATRADRSPTSWIWPGIMLVLYLGSAGCAAGVRVIRSTRPAAAVGTERHSC